MNCKKAIQSVGFFSLAVIILFAFFSSCKQNQSDRYPKRLFVNIPPDGIVLRAPWPDKIEHLSDQEIEESLQSFVNRYVGKNVSALLFNVNYQRVCYESEVWDTYWDVPQPDSIKDWPLLFWQLQKKGTDVFKVVTEYSRKHGISPWLSFRMNDHHYFNEPGKVNTFLLSDTSARPGNFFNYENPEIRDHFLKLIEEAVLRYDIDGIELDLLRTPGNYGSIATMNLFIKAVKDRLAEISDETNREIKIAVRVPSLPDGGIEYGLDPVFWTKNGWVDIVIPSNFDSFNNDIPVEDWREKIGEQNPYMILPGTSYFEYLTEWGFGHRIHQTAEGLRALTVNAFYRGADGVYVYNFFTPSDFDQKQIDNDGNVAIVNEMETMLTEGGDFEQSIDKPRRHILSWHQPGISSHVNWFLPDNFEFNLPKTYEIFTGLKPNNMAFIVRVMLNNDSTYKTSAFNVEVNGDATTQIEDLPRDPRYIYESAKANTVQHVSELGARVIQFAANTESVQDGYNTLTITNCGDMPIHVKWIEVYIGNKQF